MKIDSIGMRSMLFEQNEARACGKKDQLESCYYGPDYKALSWEKGSGIKKNHDSKHLCRVFIMSKFFPTSH